MKSAIASPFCMALAVVAVTLPAARPVAAEAKSSAADAFIAENDVAMRKMMAEMHVPPTGNVDRDFIVMMIPHHQGAIDMCAAQVRHGSNAKLKELCRRIMVDQGKEIEMMRAMLAAMPPAPAAKPSSAAMPMGHEHHHSGM